MKIFNGKTVDYCMVFLPNPTKLASFSFCTNAQSDNHFTDQNDTGNYAD